MRHGRKLLKLNAKGQHLLEYAIVVGIVSTALIAMSTYVYRSVQATQQMIQEEFSAQFGGRPSNAD